MKVLLYGGTFDPPHNGHLNNLRAAAARVQPDKVVVMPAGLSPFKQKTSAPGALRLEMCSCFHALEEDADTIPRLEVSGWEIEQAAAGNRNYTVLTVEKLARENPGAQLYLAIGSDMLLSFDGWHRWQDILRLAHLVVTSRHVGDDRAARKGSPAGPHRGTHPVCTGTGAAHGQQRDPCTPCSRGSLRSRAAAGRVGGHPPGETLQKGSISQ